MTGQNTNLALARRRSLSSNVGPLMKLSALRKFLHEPTSAAEFVADFSSEFAHYELAIRRKGTSVPVQVEEDADLSIGRPEVLVLCAQLSTGQLTEVQLAYIADALQLAERVTFSEEWVSDAVAEFTDPEINGSFTVERANEIIRAQGPNNSLQARRP